MITLNIMNAEHKKAFYGFQQGGHNAALMYRKFAEITKKPEFRQAYLEAAKDEGRHAAVIARYTGVTMRPKAFQANMLGILYRILPKKLVHLGVSKGEYFGGNGYRPYIGDTYPELKGIMEDEYRHGDIFRGLSKR